MQIAYLPFDQDENAYTTRMRSLLGQLGTVQRHAGVKPGLRAALRGQRYDATIVNWYDNELVVDGRVSYRRVARVFARTLGLRLSSKRLVFVRHNVYPHGVEPAHAPQARRWIDRYERLFHDVVTHGGHERGTRRHYVPHPLYDTTPAADETVDPAALAALPRDFFLFFGRIVPYKKIEAVAEHFPAERMLVAAGGGGDRAYVERLRRIERDNFLLRPGFLNEATAQALTRRCQALVIAHADEDVIVSGSFFYALSLGVPVLACSTPFLQWARELLGPQWVTLADSPRQLCEIARGYVRPPTTIDATQRVRDCFGDAAVLRAWRDVLAPVLRRVPVGAAEAAPTRLRQPHAATDRTP